jgi:hypothetical protein
MQPEVDKKLGMSLDGEALNGWGIPVLCDLRGAFASVGRP